MHFSMVGKDEKFKFNVFIISIALIPIGIMWMFLLNTIISSLYLVLEPTGHESIIIATGLVLTGILLLFTSIPSILSSFYFAEDIEDYLAMPFHPYQLVIGKSLAPLLTIYGLSAVIIVPILFFYGLASGGGILFALNGFLTFIFFPLIPFILSSLMVMVLMRYANISKNKDRTKLVAGMFSLFLIVGFNVIIRLNQDTEQLSQGFATWVEQQDQLLWNFTKFLPNVYAATNALEVEVWWHSILFLILFLLITVIAMALFIVFGQRFYYQGVLGIAGGGKGKKVANIETRTSSRSILWSYTIKELKTIIRTPAFFMNCVINSLFAPFFIFIMMFIDENIGAMADTLQSIAPKSILLAMFLFSLFVLGTNATATSSISREGTNWFTNLYMPIQPKTILYGKLLAAWIVEFVSIVLLLILFGFVINVPIIVLLLWLILVIGGSWISNLIGVYIDIYNPKLNWNDEQQVFKSRFAPLLSLLILFFGFGTLVLSLWFLPFVTNVWITFLILSIVIGASIYFTQRKLIQTVHNQFMYIMEK